MSNGVSMLNRKRGYAQDNKQKEVRDSLLKRVLWGIGRTVYEICGLCEKLEIITTAGVAKGKCS